MTLSPSIPFRQAAEALRAKGLLPTSLSSRELMEIAADIRERSLFSARTLFADHLQEIWDQASALADGRTDVATSRLALKDSLDRLGYTPSQEDEGTIKDLRSDQRLNLILKTNTEMAQSYGTWAQGQDPAVLDMWPAQELVRDEDRKEKRNWLETWRGAGGLVFPGQGPDAEGRLIALKNDPIWERISAFGLPYPPFDFGSGIGVADVNREEAVAFGLIDAATQIEPQTRGFNEGLQANPGELAPEMQKALAESVGSGYAFDGLTLIQKGHETPTIPDAVIPPRP